MDRQVDVKALVSHLVRGDGLHKCRICMGDTSEGQVFLGDTVMTDGERPVTLAELLETITGVEVLVDDCLPSWLCAACFKSAIDAANFIKLCRNTTNHWENTINLVSAIPLINDENENAVFALLNYDSYTVDYYLDNSKPSKPPALRLTQLLTKKSTDLEGQPYSCLNCGKKFKYPQHYFSHLKESTDLKRACFVCAKVMMRDQLIEHILTVHNKKPYYCKKCPAIFITYNTFTQHKKLAHTPGACTCGDCGRSFKTITSYHGHSTIHSLKSCPKCQKLFRNHTCYLYHSKTCNEIATKPQIESAPAPEGTVSYGSKSTYTEDDLDSNMTLQRDGKDFSSTRCICDYCGKSLAGKKFIQAHIRNVHLKSNHRTCNYCGKLYLKSYMADHLRSHENHKPAYACEICNLTMKTRIGYTQHIRLHTGEKPYECKHCGEMFSASSRRSHHIIKVHNKQVKPKHVCETCGARFRLPSLLRKHIAARDSNDKCQIQNKAKDRYLISKNVMETKPVFYIIPRTKV